MLVQDRDWVHLGEGLGERSRIGCTMTDIVCFTTNKLLLARFAIPDQLLINMTSFCCNLVS